MSQTELAKLAGLSASAISALERGVNPPTVTTLRQLAGALGVRDLELLGGEGSGTVLNEEQETLESWRQRALRAEERLTIVAEQLAVVLQSIKSKTATVADLRKDGSDPSKYPGDIKGPSDADWKADLIEEALARVREREAKSTREEK